jgi:HPt (histidine-containing phosphotransfer) domain-containing protein
MSAVQPEVIEELKVILEDEFGVLVQAFLDDAEQRLQRLQQGLEQSDADTVRAEAHSLKGSSSNVGAMNLSLLCSELEQKGLSGDLSGAATLLNRIQTAHGETTSCLRAYL